MKPHLLLSAALILTITGYCSAEPPSTQPVPRTQQFEWMSLSTWYRKHADDVAAAEAGRARVVFLGDSITDGWAPGVWKEYFAPLGAVNFGIGGDLTQNLLWRLEHGAIERLDPQVVVILIGVNNFLHNDASARDTFAGVKAVAQRSLSGYPDARLILQGILPYGRSPGTPERARVTATNRLIATLAEHPRIDYYDFGRQFLDDQGRIHPSIMADYLHPTERGYRRWARVLAPIIGQQIDKGETP